MNEKKHIYYNTAGNVVTLFFQWVILLIIPKITNFDDAGIFAVAVSICTVLNIVATLNLNQHQVSDGYDNYSESDYFSCRVVTIIFSFIVAISISTVLQYSIQQTAIILAYLAYRNFINYAYLHIASLQIYDHLDYAGKCMIVEGFVSFLSFTFVYLETNSLVLSTITMACLGGGLFLLLISAGYRHYFSENYSYYPFNNKAVKSLLLVGAPLFLSLVSPLIITAFPKIILQEYWPDNIVGVFSTLTAPTSVIPTVITAMFTPFIGHFSNLAKQRKMGAIRRDFLKIVLLIVIIGIAAYFVSLLSAEFFYRLLYGDEIVEYVPYFHILIIGIVAFSIGMCGLTVLLTKKQELFSAWLSLISLFASFIIFMLTIPTHGLDGATYGLLASYLIFALVVVGGVLLKPVH